jgi:hypothetical protein
MPSEREIAESRPDLRKETMGKVPMDCIMLGQPIKNVAYAPLGLFPKYCFDHDKDSLRVSYKFGSTPDADLAIASLAAVRQWIYKPYLLNGEPVEVDTQLTANFSSSRR